MRMKEEIDVEQEIDEIEEEPSETESSNVYRRPKAYRHLTDAQYNRCVMRERFVTLAYQDKRDAVRYLRSVEDRFRRAGYTDNDKQCMYRALMIGGPNGLMMEDIDYCNYMFGRLQKSYPNPSNIQIIGYSSKTYRYVPQTPLEWVKYHRDTTFENFRQWVARNQHIAEKLDKDGLEELRSTIEKQTMEGHVLPFQQEYTPELDDEWLDELRQSIDERERILDGL